MTDDHLPIVPGTLEMLVLKTLSLEPMHGWGIGERIQQLSHEAFRVNQGTLYPGARATPAAWMGYRRVARVGE